jgi:hypothetical protein
MIPSDKELLLRLVTSARKLEESQGSAITEHDHVWILLVALTDAVEILAQRLPEEPARMLPGEEGAPQV